MAGGVIWAAPVLRSTPVWADTTTGGGCDSCSSGTPATLKISSTSGSTCTGISCLSQIANEHLDCSSLASCLTENGFVALTQWDNSGPSGRNATVVLKNGVDLIATSVKIGSPDACYYAHCTDDWKLTSDGEALDSQIDIQVNAVPGGDTTIHYVTDTRTINHVEVQLCVSPVITGQCP